jgi:hypothetical protein
VRTRSRSRAAAGPTPTSAPVWPAEGRSSPLRPADVRFGRDRRGAMRRAGPGALRASRRSCRRPDQS